MKLSDLNKLRQRLKSLDAPAEEAPETLDEPAAAEPDPDHDPDTAALRERLRRLHRLAAARQEAHPPQPLQLTHRYSRQRQHGLFTLDAIFDAARQTALDELVPELHQLDPATALFLDTETTGLDGGAGALVFAIGCGTFDDTHFTVEQELVEDFPDEPRALRAFVERLQRASSLVTFNGAAFDLDRLRMRLTLHRIEHPLDDLPHLDLLHPARRLFGLALEGDGCSLQTIERRLLDFHRHDDVHGADAPRRWYTWLRTRDDALIEPVLRHNRIDIVSLVALATLILKRVPDPVAAAASPAESLAAARFLTRHTQREDSPQLALRGLDDALDGHLRPQHLAAALRDKIALLQRQRRHAEALEPLRELLALHPDDPWALTRLAIIHEHATGDLDAALAAALRLAALRPDDPAATQRLRRIERKREARLTPLERYARSRQR